MVKLSRIATSTLIGGLLWSSAIADSSPKPLNLDLLSPGYTPSGYLTTTDSSSTRSYQAASFPGKPRIGVRVGAGSWDAFTLSAGIDVTFHVPVLPIPELRVDAEAWASTGSFADRQGNAISVLAIQNYALGYAGIGPSFYFTDNSGDHDSGVGLKVLGGVNLPEDAFVEISWILGPSPSAETISIGKKF